MKYLFKISLLSLFLGFTQSFNAQIETQTEKIGNGELSTTMDQRINNALEELECDEKSDKSSTATTKTSSTNTSSNKKLTNAEICKQNPRILGYKIQIAVVKSKEEADKIRTDFRNQFSNLKVEVDASLRPNYRILAGSYFTKESASGDLRRIRTSFKSASSVQYRIFCAEAK